MRFRGSFWRGCSLVTVLLIVCLLLPAGAAFAEPSFVNNQFQAKWQRADKPVQDGNSNPSRSWLWGPEGFNQSGATTEPYAGSPGGTRQIQYFDKARMELNNPSTGLVTSGLLVIEMISGREATGDATGITRKPADIPVAGDATNNDGPTYASLASVASLNLDKPSPDRTGQQAGDTLDKAGKTGTNPDLAGKARYAYFDSVLKHNIPDVFWNFMNQKGNIYENGTLADNQPILGSNPDAPWLDSTGYPLTEAYWVRVKVGGAVKDVLIQAFQRRVLTFTPDNPAQYQVEMGNVGRHYFTWRYSSSYDIPTTPPPTTSPTSGVTGCSQLPASTGRTFFPCGPAGMPIMIVADMGPNETALISLTDPNGNNVAVGAATAAPSGQIKIVRNSLTTDTPGMWTYKIKGLESNREAVLYIWLDPPVTKPTIFINPATARKDQGVEIVAVGFTPSESLLITLKSPDNITFSLSENIPATGGGGYIDEFVVSRDLPAAYQQPGVWSYSVISKTTQSNYAAGQFTIIS